MILGLDWDETVTEYANGLAQIARYAKEVHIITLNPKITQELARKRLNYNGVVQIHVMPEEAFNTSLEDVGIGKWKAQKCVESKVELMIDDYGPVVEACEMIGIPAIQVHLRD